MECTDHNESMMTTKLMVLGVKHNNQQHRMKKVLDGTVFMFNPYESTMLPKHTLEKKVEPEG